MEKILFKETQNNTILIIAGVVFTLLFGALCVVQIGFHQPIGNHPAPNGILLFFFSGSIAATVFVYCQKLKVVITKNEILVSFGLFANKTIIPKVAIRSMQIRKYNAIKEFTGWGVRNNGNESCFTVSGSDALEIELETKQRILIGTHMPKIMQPVLDNYLDP